MEIINCNTYKVVTKPLEEYMKIKIKSKICADSAFQACSGYLKKGKDGRWNKPNNTLYMTNLIRGHAPSSFVFADMEKCLDFMKKQGDRKKDVFYYTTWLSRGKYMNMDSYNRNSALGDYDVDADKALGGFFADEIPILHGPYLLPKGKVINIDSSNNIWSTIPKELKNYILKNIKITMIIYNNCTVTNLSEICRAVNEGVPFLPALYRNTFTTNVAYECRFIAENEINFFDAAGCKWFSPDGKIKRDVDATIAKMLWMTRNSFDKKVVNDSELLKMYTDDMDVDHLKKGVALINEFLKVLKDCKDELGGVCWYAVQTKVVVLYHLFDFFLEAAGKGLEVDNNKLLSMFVDFNKVYTNLLADQKTSWPTTKGKTALFKTIKNGTQLYNIKLFKEILKNKFNFEDYCSEKSKRVYDADDKLVLAVNQNWITPEGHKIAPSNLLDPVEHEGGHKISWKNSKDTSLDNGAIQKTPDNRKLGENNIVYADD